MNEENDWYHMTEASIVEGLNERVNYEEMIIPIKAMEPGLAARPFEVHTEMISVNEEVGISVMMKLCQYDLDGKGMLNTEIKRESYTCVLWILRRYLVKFQEK